MALPVPSLDDRRFQDLVDDAKRLVQQRCPEWTDHNVSDPGVTLIETFAWMTDQERIVGFGHPVEAIEVSPVGQGVRMIAHLMLTCQAGANLLDRTGNDG